MQILVFVKDDLAGETLFTLDRLAVKLNFRVSEATNHFENVSEIANFDSLACLPLDQFPQFFD